MFVDQRTYIFQAVTTEHGNKGNISQDCAQVDGRGVGPLRVWPGGLAMGRTLGDASGGDAVLCIPEIRQASSRLYGLHPSIVIDANVSSMPMTSRTAYLSTCVITIATSASFRPAGTQRSIHR